MQAGGIARSNGVRGDGTENVGGRTSFPSRIRVGFEEEVLDRVLFHEILLIVFVFCGHVLTFDGFGFGSG